MRLYLLPLLGVALGVSQAHSQSASGARFDAAVGYTFVHTNAPPGGCGCFSMNGGSSSLAWNFARSFGVVGEIAGQHASNIGVASQDLTLISYLAGPRYRRQVTTKVVPFGQILLGAAHASGSLAPGTEGNIGSSSVFAAVVGGGVDIALSRRFAFRPAELDYYLTQFHNGSNQHQNNFRYSAAMVFRFGKRS